MTIVTITALLGLLLTLVYLYVKGYQNLKKVKDYVNAWWSNNCTSHETIPRWTSSPADDELGDLGELAKYGSLHQYLVHLHENGRIPVTSFWWRKTRVVSVCSPQAFKDTLRMVNRPVEQFIAFEPLIGSTSIEYANDDEWEQRQRCVYHTLKGKELKEYFPVFVKIAQEAESQWSSYSSDQHMSLVKEAFPMTVKGFARACLGDIFENQSELDILAGAYHKCWKFLEDTIIIGPSDSERKADFQRNKQVIVDIIQRVVQDRKEGVWKRDVPFIDAMLQNYDSEIKVVADAITFLIGGFHTFAYLLTWMLWYLAENSDSQDRLKAEIDSEVGPEYGEKLKKYAGRSDTFMRQVIDETIRLSTLAPYAARYSNKDAVVCGHTIKAGTPVIQALGVGLKNHNSWENVEIWNPDRFSADGKRNLDFCPFGIPSSRKCPGYLYSYFKVSVFAAILLRQFKLEPVEGQTVTQVQCGFVTEPKEELLVYVGKRK